MWVEWLSGRIQPRGEEGMGSPPPLENHCLDNEKQCHLAMCALMTEKMFQ